MLCRVVCGPVPLEGLGWGRIGDIIDLPQDHAEMLLARHFVEPVPQEIASVADPGEVIPPVDAEDAEDADTDADVEEKSTEAPRNKLARGGRNKEILQ